MIKKLSIWLCTIIIVVVGLYQATSLQSNYSQELFAFDNKEEIERYHSFSDQFSGESKMLIIGLSSEDGFNQLEDFLKVDSLIDQIEKLKGVVSVGFISKLDYPSKRGAFISKEKLLPLNSSSSFDRHFKELDKYTDITPKFLSADRSSIALYVNLKKGINSYSAVTQLRHVLHDTSYSEKHVIGKSLNSEEIGRRITKDSLKITIIGLILLMLGFAILFRGFREVIFLLTNVLLSLSLYYIVFKLMNKELNALNLTIPLFVTVLSLSDAVHVMIAQRSGNPYKKVGLALLLTTLTTILSFILFLVTGSSVVISFALLAITGVGIAYLITRFVAPLYFHILPTLKEFDETIGWRSLVTRRPMHVSMIGGIVILLLLFLVGNTIRIDQKLYDHLDKDSDEYRSLMFYEENFGGTRRFDIYLQSDDSILNSTSVDLLDTLENALMKEEGITNVFSLNTIVKRYNRFEKAGKPEEFRLPDVIDSPLINDVYRKRKELGLNNAVNSDTNVLRVSVSGYDIGAKDHLSLVERIKSYEFLNNMDSIQVYVGSKTTINDLSATKISSRILQSLVVAILAVVLVLAIGLRSIRLGIASLVSNLLPLVAVGLTILLIEGQFNPVNLMVLTIILGVALDDTIHILSRYYHERQVEKKGAEASLAITLADVGNGVLRTSLLLALGFCALFFSEFTTNQNSGVYFVVGILSAVFADLFLLPNIIIALSKKSRLN